MNKTQLCHIFQKHGSDKCPAILHSYSPEYYNLLVDRKYSVKNILEIGVGTQTIMSPIVGESYSPGASLKSWAEFFPNASVFGCDIDKSVLFNDDRIKCYYMDQSNQDSILQTIKSINIDKYDLIIDDGSHILEHMIVSINTIYPFIDIGGIYIIEDIKLKDIDIFKNYSKPDLKVKFIHYGKNEWDSFIAYEKYEI